VRDLRDLESPSLSQSVARITTMLMPSTVDSPLPSIMAPTNLTASTNVTPTSASIVPTVTTTIQPIQQRDTTWTKLFVGGLPYHTTDKSLREHFEVYGDIEEAVVITDRSTGKSRGYGFVIMSNKEAAERACKEPNPIIDGRKANVNLAILGAKPRGNLTAQLPLTAIRPGFPAAALMAGAGQYGELTLAGQLGFPGTAAAAAAQTAAIAAAPAAAQQLAAASQQAPGKARSSMSLGLISGRQPVAAPASHPYLQQLYAAAAAQQQQAAYGLSPNIMQLAGLQGGTGNPLLDMYSQYAAAYSPQQMVPAVTQAQALTTSLEQQQQQPQQLPQSLVAGQSQAYAQALQYAYAPNMLTAQQLTAAGLTSPGFPAYAAAAGPAPAGQPNPQQQPAEQRIQ